MIGFLGKTIGGASRRRRGTAPRATQPEPRQVADALVARADRARDDRRFRDAAVLYTEALEIIPDDAGIRIQCGHAFKEAGDLLRAENQYGQALRLIPDDPELALQLGHFYKVAGRVTEAADAYARASALRPDWNAPAAELRFLRSKGFSPADGWAGDRPAGDGAGTGAAIPAPTDTIDDAAESLLASMKDGLVSEIVPRKPDQLFHSHHESVSLRRFGRRERTAWGFLPTFRGVEAVRGFCISASPVVEVQILLNDLLIHREVPCGGYRLQYERDPGLLKYVFNAWLDLSAFAAGRYDMEVRCITAQRGTHAHREHVVVAAPLLEQDHPDSDGVITLPPEDNRPVAEQINARPSMVRPPRPALFPNGVSNVLVLRTDQLGDMVTSIPAMRRLRELLPGARVVGLLTSSNAEFAATLGLFDEIIVVDFPDDLIERRRTMPFRAQEALRARLAPYRFDLAIDLAESSMSRPLLLLSGAAFTYGFYDRDWPWLSAGFEGATHDVWNGKEVAPHSTRVLALVERLGAMLHSRAEVVRRADLSRGLLARYGITGDDRFAVLHTGARIEFSRWPRYAELAGLILQRTGLKVVLLTDDPRLRDSLPPDVANSWRFRLVDKRLSFDDFDALVSFCAVFVGNDSGPKHLASVRGANVVSIHSARVNWDEWGQEMTGVIVSRKVPCAGCSLYHDVDECGKGYPCVTHISLEEVFGAVAAYT